MTMEALERKFGEATSKKVLPAVLLAAANKDGSLDYFHAFGNHSLAYDSPPVSAASTFILASATKLATCVAAMQCVERGLIGLDDDVSKILLEFEDAEILVDFEKRGDEEKSGRPILVKAKNRITMRHLLSHSSGITGFENEMIMQYLAAIGSPVATVIPRYFMSDDEKDKEEALCLLRKLLGTLEPVPLVFEPGTKWGYGQSTDWAGQIVERLTNMALEEYSQKNIFGPLGMKSTTYRPLSHPNVISNLIQMHARNSDLSISNAPSIYPLSPSVDLGGSSLYSTASDFMALLKTLLKNDGKVLKQETVDEMFDYRLPETKEFDEFRSYDVEDTFRGFVNEGDGLRVDHCLAGMVVLEDLKGGRKSGSIHWGGATSCDWWIDRKSGICGFYGGQIMAMKDQGISKAHYRKFEKAIYENYGGGSCN